ncbi:MAG: 50S ribosomal protein L29, partial [Alphaproteobacteria bacterium]
MKATDMRSMSVEGLRQYILDGRQELMNLRFQQANLVLNGTSRMRQL